MKDKETIDRLRQEYAETEFALGALKQLFGVTRFEVPADLPVENRIELLKVTEFRDEAARQYYDAFDDFDDLELLNE